MIFGKEIHLTKEGLGKAEKEYEILKAMRLEKTSAGFPESWHSEELSSEYLAFKEDIDLLDRRLLELEYILKNVNLIVPPPKDQRGAVALGAKVLVEIDGKDKDEFLIVGTFEADPRVGKISNESPVGKALLGGKTGEEIIISSPIKTVYKIKKIKYN